MSSEAIFTIGHSTRELDELIEILESYKINILVDIRRYPRSRTNPQFNSDTFGLELKKHKIEYVWLENLGGRRQGSGELSKNACWKNQSFRNFADYMESSSFHTGFIELLGLRIKINGIVALMCSELLYWRCHRSLISDLLKSKGLDVIHIFDQTHSRSHKFTECARIVDGELTYHST